jgi:hypothetical protein
MPTPLIPLTIQAPGFKGLNSQQSSTSLDTGWATELENATFDLTGRITSRKGISNLTTSGGPGANNLSQVFCWETFYNNTYTTGVISAGNLKIYNGTTTLSDVTGTITAPTANNWQFMNYRNDRVIGVQQGHTPCVATIAVGALGNFANVVAASGSVPTGNSGIAAFGRIWVADSDGLTIKYCALLDETKWAAVDGGGSIDTSLYWPRGRDYIVALAAWEDKLVVFGRHNILVYSYPGTPAAIDLSDTIEGTGCIARDSVQPIGTDILFLSESGVRSLKKSIITQKAPVQELSLPVRDTLLQYTTPGNVANIRSVYNQTEGFYLLAIVGSSDTKTFCFDVKQLVQESQFPNTEGVRISRWVGFPIHGIAYGRDRVMYVSYRSGSNEKIGFYSGYYDGGTTGYTLKYSSPWIDLANPQGGDSGTFYKILKQANVTTVGSNNYQINFGVSFDFASTGYTQAINVSTTGAVISEWNGNTAGVNLTEWGIAEYNSSSKVMNTSKVQLGRYGQHLKLSVSVPVMGYEISLQKVDLFMKKGRVSR